MDDTSMQNQVSMKKWLRRIVLVFLCCLVIFVALQVSIWNPVPLYALPSDSAIIWIGGFWLLGAIPLLAWECVRFIHNIGIHRIELISTRIVQSESNLLEIGLVGLLLFMPLFIVPIIGYLMQPFQSQANDLAFQWRLTFLAMLYTTIALGSNRWMKFK
ncbi:MAG: hypothetical protein P1Q69_15045 [Candidatus Thorarchaeota archaeon]|nr:hypothetical protein [Candidatus Thorarchaeota archaeon]